MRLIAASRKMTVLIVLAAMALSLSSGCFPAGETTTAAAPTTETGLSAGAYIWKPDPPDLEWKDDTSPVTLTCYVNALYDSRDWNWGNDIISQEVTRKTGVTIQGTFATDNEGTKLGLMLASGDKLPDFIIGVKDNMMSGLIKENYIYSITDLIDEYAPEMRKVMLKNIEEFAAEEDGKLYFLGCTMQGSDQLGDPSFAQHGQYALRADIMKKLGDPPLKTPEDLLSVLELVRTSFPDIKFPIYLESFDGGWNGFQWPLFRTFGGKSGYDQEKDTVVFWYETPAFLEMYKYANTLYRKGFINEEIFNIKDKRLEKELANGEVFFYGVGNYLQIYSANSKLKELHPDMYYTPIEPIIAPGKKYELPGVFSATTWRNVIITKDSVNPARAIKYLEFMISSEGQSLFAYGIEGVHYQWQKSDEGLWYPVFTPEIENLRWSDMAGLSTKYGIYSWEHYFWIINIMTDNILTYGTKFKDTGRLMAHGINIYTKYATFGKVSGASGNTNLQYYPEASSISSKIDEFCIMQIPKMVVADTDEEFDQAYQDFNAGIHQLGVDKMREAYIESAHDYLDLCKKANLELTD
jgi:putative aldouronate transport system substrate-binding protein